MNSLLPLLSLTLLMAASMALGWFAHRASESGGFLKGYFLGNRGLGSWSMALTATVMSGGTFLGFPALVYQYGWVLSLWIASYMMVPLCTFAVLGKRFGRLARETGAITLPDLLRERFQSPAVGGVASVLMIFILTFSLNAQFKSGALILQQVLPGLPVDAGWNFADKSAAYLIGLAVFTLVVVTYTVWGGFLAAIWTDVLQSVLMAVGILILFPLVLMKSGGLEAGTQAGIRAVGEGFAFAPGAGREFLPVSLVASFFCMWSIAGMGQPATLVRLMAYKDTQTLRRAIGLLAVYNTLIYLPLLFTFICARALLPNLAHPDEVMPRLALNVASPWLGGLILTAPFGAVMATVSAFLVQISSALTQDVYHRHINPQASERQLRLLSQFSIVVVALCAAVGAIYSPKFLQAIIVFAGGSAACAFLVPALMAAFWARATARGAMAAMLGGVLTMLLLYLPGWLGRTRAEIGEPSGFAPYYLFGMAPFVWGLCVSAFLGVCVSFWGGKPTNATQSATN